MAHVNLKALLQNFSTISHSHLKQCLAHLLITGKSQLKFCRVRSKIIESYALSPFNDLSYAYTVFRQIKSPSTNDFNAILRGLAQCSEPRKAISWYRTMLSGFNKIDALTCSFALKACARILATCETMQIHSQVVRYGFLVDSLLGTTLLDAYAKVGEIRSAKKVFDEMLVRDIASWNALIAGLVQGNFAGEGIDLFKRMKMEGVFKPNEITVLGALAACSHLGALNEGEKIYDYIREESLDMNVIVCNAVIDMYAKCGFVDKAFSVFSNTKCRKSLVTWNTMIMAFAMHGDGAKSLDLFDQMGQNGVKPDEISYLAVLCACNHSGLVADGMRLFNSMRNCGVKLSVKHYGSIVDLLGRAGRLQEAYDIIKSIPMGTDDVVLWQTLLGACQLYGNVEMAEIASMKLVEMGSNNCGDFVLLSNIYATHERWDDVGRVRKTMKFRDVKKVPGFSYIEVDGILNRFFTGDKSHLNSRAIYEKLNEIMFKIKVYGYSAETNYVLHDIGEEEKENALCYHSEKLAVAFGLMNTSEGASIHVFKNLRICGDCHAVIKLISKIYKREIIVRDRVRFHRFKEGSCSCNDYW